MKVRIFSGIILIIFGAVFTRYAMEDKDKLTYYLSDRIPTQFTKASEQESLQILELKNKGVKSITRAILKINSEISSYEVNRIMESDSIISNNSLQNLEIEYLKIPPTQKVSIIIKSLGKGITYDDLTVLHDNGIGARENEDESNSQWSYWLFILIYLSLILKTTKESIQFSSINDLFYDSYDSVLAKDKPFYISDSFWEKMRFKAIRFAFINDNSLSIENRKYYIYLNSETPKTINTTEELELNKRAETAFLLHIRHAMNNVNDFNVNEFSDIVRPLFCSDKTWNKVVTLITETILSNKLQTISSFPSLTSVEKLIENKPRIITDHIWDKFKSSIRDYSNNLKYYQETKTLISRPLKRV